MLIFGSFKVSVSWIGAEMVQALALVQSHRISGDSSPINWCPLSHLHCGVQVGQIF